MDIDVGKPQMYTTGAYISPQRIKVNDRKVWVWVVDSFDEDTFSNGDCISVVAIGDNPEDLIRKEGAE